MLDSRQDNFQESQTTENSNYKETLFVSIQSMGNFWRANKNIFSK